MKRKLFAYGLSVALLLVQNSFIFAQTAATRSTDELIALLDEPEAVAVINIRKMLNDIAPTLLNRDAELLAKLAAAMKSIEEETGVNPYSIDKIVVGAKIDKPGDKLLLVIQSDSSSKMLETIYQNQLDDAKLGNEINPLKAKILTLSTRNLSEELGSNDNNPAPAINDALDKLISDAGALESALDALTGTKMNQPLIDAVLTDATRIRVRLETIRKDFEAGVKPNDFSDRIELLKKQTDKISARDTGRVAKIADLEKQLSKLEGETDKFYYRTSELKLMVNDRVDELTRTATLEQVKTSVNNPPASEARRAASYRAMQKQLAGMQKNLTLLADEMKIGSSSAPPILVTEPLDLIDQSTVYPMSTVITRKDETLDGKKTAVVKTVKKYGSEREDVIEEEAMMLVDDRILMLGERVAVVESLVSKSADRNRAARDLIAKSGDALVAFGVDLKTIDLQDFAEVFGEQKTAWQIFGSLSSAGNDLTVEAIVEKTNRPLALPAKTMTDDKPKIPDLPMVGDTNVITDLLDLAVKSVVGIEGKFTLRFEKKKAVAMLENAPELLRKWTRGSQNPARQSNSIK